MFFQTFCSLNQIVLCNSQSGFQVSQTIHNLLVDTKWPVTYFLEEIFLSSAIFITATLREKEGVGKRFVGRQRT